MKIQIFTRNFLGKISNFNVDNLSAIGGAEIYLMQLIDAINIRYKDASVEVYQVGDVDEEVDLGKFSLKHIKLNSIEKLIFPFVLSFKFKKYIDKDAIKIFNYPNYAAFVGKQKKSIGIFHGVEWDTTFLKYVYMEYKYKYRSLKGIPIAISKYIYFKIFVPLMVKKGIDQIDTLVSVDHNILNYIKKEKHVKKIQVIHNCVNVKMFSNDIQPPKNVKTTILVPRNLNVARGVFMLPGIVKHILQYTDSFVIKVAGTGPLETFLRDEIEKEKIQRYIELLGHVSNRDDMVELYRASDIILIPTVFSEGTSLSALEALACRKPVIMTNVGGLKEIGVDGIDKISVEANPKKIAEKILELINNRSLIEQLNRNSRRCVEENHSYQEWSDKWLKIIDRYYK